MEVVPFILWAHDPVNIKTTPPLPLVHRPACPPTTPWLEATFYRSVDKGGGGGNVPSLCLLLSSQHQNWNATRGLEIRAIKNQKKCTPKHKKTTFFCGIMGVWSGKKPIAIWLWGMARGGSFEEAGLKYGNVTRNMAVTSGSKWMVFFKKKISGIAKTAIF
jgi:hypothetical protein